MRSPFLAGAAVLMYVATAAAQGPPFMATFPSRPKADAATLNRGKEAYKTNCAYCHGEDVRGGDNGGINLLRADIVMKDKSGELLRAFLANPGANGHVSAREGAQKFNFSEVQASDLAAFIHDFRLSSRDPGRMRPPTILVSDAKAGERYFQAKCASCHSVTGDLKGIASRITDPRSLQQTWLMPIVYGTRFGERPEAPRRVPPPTVTITMANGQKLEGRLNRIDDFIVTLTQADGTQRTVDRDGDVPKVEVHDPMKPHKDLLPVYTDADIHNVTAYLATIK
jgi:cytochrome c oxidase cbb3-type subunit III